MIRAALVALAALLLAAPAGAASPGERFQAVLDRVVADHALVPGTVLHIDGPRSGLPWTGAAGFHAEHSPRPLTPEDPFRIASVQKMFTGAAILRLVEDGRLSLDDPIAPYLDQDQVDRIHVLDGVDHSGRITIRQLLSHTSGLNSHDAECPRHELAIATGPRRRWTPRELIEAMIECGDPKFAPGTPGRWNYSDTGFVMLGLVLAQRTGKTYAGALRELLPLERLGMASTWHELLEPERASARPRAHQYVAALDLTDWDPSFDSWGGGGYASTVRDLATFVRALFEHRVFRKRSTLELMTEQVPMEGGHGPRGADAYGLGLYHVTYDGVGCWGHAGFWSVLALYCPALGIALATTTNQAMDEHGEHTEDRVSIPAVAITRSLPARSQRPQRKARGRCRVNRRAGARRSGSRCRRSPRATGRR